MQKNYTLFTLIAIAALSLLGCQTAALLTGLTQNNARPPATRTTNSSGAAPKTTAPDASGDPNANSGFEIIGTPRCSGGDDSVSLVTGQILQNGNPLSGQQVQASSSEGGDPISDQPALTNGNGDFQIPFVCGGSACNGAFWLWLIDPDGNQNSPYVQFVFDNQCRRGTVNFAAP